MASDQSPVGELGDDDLLRIESLILAGVSQQAEARSTLRRYLFGRAGEGEANGSIGDALALLARQATISHAAAIVLLRCLAVPGLVPEANSANQIARLAVEVCEKAAPQILSLLKIDKRLQNYEKFPIIRQCHNEILTILKPVSDRYGDLSALISARREIMGALNHSIVRDYCSIYRLNEIKSIIKSIFGALQQISQLDVTLLSTITECNRRIDAARADFVGSETFLSEELLNPFLGTCEILLAAFFEVQRTKFDTKIVPASPSELEKRYPLQVTGKELHISLPLRNLGPGLATDVRVTFSSDSNDIVLSNMSVALGNVLPGEFSATVTAEVISPAQGFGALAIIEWGEIGSPSRREDVFEFNVVTQRGDIDWHNLEYQTPYTTGIAEGVHFTGVWKRFISSPLGFYASRWNHFTSLVKNKSARRHLH